MYLEISPRQTGKTTRLIETAMRCKNDVIGIIAASQFHLDSIRKRIEKEFPDYQKTIIFSISMIESNSAVDPEIEKFFVDDFDFIIDEGLFIDPKGYYVTTPRKIRSFGEIMTQDDFFCVLLHQAQLYYHSCMIGKEQPDLFHVLYNPHRF